MGKDFLSIKDFAEAAGFTPQGIYKRLSDEENELHRFCRKENGKTVISAAALAAIFNKEYKPHEQEQPKDESSSTDKVIEILKEQIEAQRKDIEEKNNLINTLAAQLENSQKLISQEQQLNYANTQKILALEAAAEEREAAAAMPIEKEKKGFFSIFKRKGSAGN